jgi:glycerol-3-phosphate O-acyltransferase
MTDVVEIPVWFFLILATVSAYAVVAGIFLPGVRWFIRRRLNRAIQRINSSLRIQIRPFQRTRRQVLIDRLSYDPQVIAEIEKLATDSDAPRRALQKKVRTYAREIVPSFNA